MQLLALQFCARAFSFTHLVSVWWRPPRVFADILVSASILVITFCGLPVRLSGESLLQLLMLIMMLVLLLLSSCTGGTRHLLLMFSGVSWARLRGAAADLPEEQPQAGCRHAWQRLCQRLLMQPHTAQDQQPGMQ